jgi:hypothetical protein
MPSQLVVKQRLFAQKDATDSTRSARFIPPEPLCNGKSRCEPKVCEGKQAVLMIYSTLLHLHIG